MKPRFLSLLSLLSLIACAPATEWARPDTTPAQIAADQKACDSIAAAQALDESFASGPKYPPLRDTQFMYGRDDDGGGVSSSYTRRGPRLYELAEYCMQQRGYRLVPVKS